MIETQKYIRKPLYVDSVRVTDANFDEIAAWCQGEILQDEGPATGPKRKFIKVRVHNPKNPRQTKAFVGDWLLYTERGYKVYTNKAFRDAFDPVVVPVEPTGEPITYVPATPEGIAEAAKQNDVHAVQDSAEAQLASGRRVLSLEEQEEMDPDELRDLLKLGDVVLAQDVAA